MININDKDKKFILENIENADKLLLSDDVNDILEAVDEIITYRGFTSDQDALNDFGREMQNIYDRVYDLN